MDEISVSRAKEFDELMAKELDMAVERITMKYNLSRSVVAKRKNLKVTFSENGNMVLMY